MCQLFLLSLNLFWLTQVCILPMILTLSFYISTQYDQELVKWNIRQVRQASKSMTGTLRRSLEIRRCSLHTLPPKKMWFKKFARFVLLNLLLIKYGEDCFRRNCEDSYCCCLKLLSHLGIVGHGDHSAKLFSGQKP